MDEAAASAVESTSVGQQVFSTHYRRLQDIEQRVVHAIQAASIVMDQLAQKSENVDREYIRAGAEGFVEQVKEAQHLVLEAIKAAAPERKFEANNYFPMVQSMVAAEKLDAVSVHVSGISKLLRQHKQQQDHIHAADAAANGTRGDTGDVAAAGDGDDMPGAGIEAAAAAVHAAASDGAEPSTS